MTSIGGQVTSTGDTTEVPSTVVTEDVTLQLQVGDHKDAIYFFTSKFTDALNSICRSDDRNWKSGAFFLSSLFFSLVTKCSLHLHIRPNTVKMESRSSNRHCMQMSVAALLPTAKRRKQPEYHQQQKDEEKCGVHNIMEYYP